MSRHAPWSVSETVAAAFAYHDVTDDPRDSGFQWRGAAPYTIGRVAFRSHLEAMATAAMPRSSTPPASATCGAAGTSSAVTPTRIRTSSESRRSHR